MTNPSTDLALAWDTPTPVAQLSIDELKAEAVHLAISLEKGQTTLREWRLRLGEVLTEIKNRVGHGQWLPYIRENLELERAQVSNYMLLAANYQRVSDLPAGMSMREELKALRQRRVVRPVPIEDGEPDGRGGIDGEASRSPLLRFTAPDTPTAVVVESILLTLFPDALTVLDVTWGSGNFWKGSSPYRVTGHDIDETLAPDGPMDFTDLRYDDAVFDVGCIDPPHLADGGDEGEIVGRFGTVKNQEELDTLIIDGTREVWRTCSLGMIVKVTNHVHGHHFQYEQALVEEALDWKIDLYDLVYQTRSHAFIDPTWGEQCSAYNNGSVYMIYRKGDQRHLPRHR